LSTSSLPLPAHIGSGTSNSADSVAVDNINFINAISQDLQKAGISVLCGMSMWYDISVRFFNLEKSFFSITGFSKTLLTEAQLHN